MKMITTPQLKKIHTLLRQLGLMDSKQEIVHSFTEGRTESSREMTLQEAKCLIDWLEDSQERTKVIRRIWHLAYEMEIIVPGDPDEKAMNIAKLDSFCKERGTVKKAISAQDLKEVKRTAKQFEAMYGKHTQKQKHQALLESLKKELELSVAAENYEHAAQIKMTIDNLNENKSKRKRASKTA